MERNADDAVLELKRSSQDEAVCFPVDPLPTHIKPSYRCLALISRIDHLKNLDPMDDKTLIVSCDWLLSQEMLADGRHCLYYERGLFEEADSDRFKTDLHLRANDWVFENGKDLTFFHGVSLGKLFCGDLTMCLINHHRIEVSLRKLIERFQPEEILYFDFISEVNVIDDTLRKEVMESVARDYGVRFIDRKDIVRPADSEITDNPANLRGHGPFARALLFVYPRIMEALTNLRCLFKDKKNRIFVIFITNMAQPLVRGFSNHNLTPIFLARTLPKKLGILWHCLKQGILLITPRIVSLSIDDRERLEEIQTDLLAAFKTPAKDTRAITRAYAKKNILETGKLTKVARDVCAAERLLDRYRPRRIVVDGEKNPPPRIYIELAKARNIAVDHTWHAPMTPKSQKHDALVGDSYTAPQITRYLTWGMIHEMWLDTIGAKQPRVRIGCPLSDKYNKPGVTRPQKKQNVLVLQYTPNLGDLRGLNTNMYGFFVDAVRMLRDQGFEDICFKIHPGPGRWKVEYFNKIARHFSLQCQILKFEPFEDCVDWADIVIGPAQTGAMFETIAGGRAYHAMLMPPHGMDERYFGDYPLLHSVPELAKALDRPVTPETGRRLLNALYSVDEFPSGSQRFWEVMEDDLG